MTLCRLLTNCVRLLRWSQIRPTRIISSVWHWGLLADGARLTRSSAAALRKRPSDPEIHFNFGVFLGRQADWQGAAREFRQVVALRPGHSKAHCLLASALEAMGEKRASQNELKLAKDLGDCEVEMDRR